MLSQPTPSAPIMFGEPSQDTDLLPWSDAERRLVEARNYWSLPASPEFPSNGYLPAHAAVGL
ncbi:hypothetical protein EV193_109158 [Herbihabitans rhizosphaerae]|uniref:Uncharacterized protein n=1 Tax=Herbihabitans rhizosphaerae TaxID=1872711 RepID=A0A4Q7KHJ5_9PSEU|nr:hypothetical protein [Herbihabitans rhizosphaerae]RZS34371.1 hypothetical protein EV193_109158 [Herbihabitans rhizosphaerae]